MRGTLSTKDGREEKRAGGGHDTAHNNDDDDNPPAWPVPVVCAVLLLLCTLPARVSLSLSPSSETFPCFTPIPRRESALLFLDGHAPPLWVVVRAGDFPSLFFLCCLWGHGT